MDPEYIQHLRERMEKMKTDYRGTVWSVFSIRWEDGNSDEDAAILIKSSLANTSSHTLHALQAADIVLADETADDFILDLTMHELQVTLPAYDAAHARAWLRQKTELMRSLYESEVKAHGGKVEW